MEKVEEQKALLKEVRESTDVSGLQLFFSHNKRHEGFATRMHSPRCTIDPESGENVVSSTNGSCDTLFAVHRRSWKKEERNLCATQMYCSV